MLCSRVPLYPTTALMAALAGQGRVPMSSPLAEAKNDSERALSQHWPVQPWDSVTVWSLAGATKAAEMYWAALIGVEYHPRSRIAGGDRVGQDVCRQFGAQVIGQGGAGARVTRRMMQLVALEYIALPLEALDNDVWLAGALSSRGLTAAFSVIGGWVPAPDALTVGQASELAGDLPAMRFVIPAGLSNESASALTDAGSPCPELVIGCGYRRRFDLEDVFRILLEQRIDGAARAAVVSFGRSWPSGEDVDLI
jgi:hypothetical protein